MPKIKLSALASDIKGKAEGSVFSRNSGGLYFRNNPSGGGKKSSQWDKAKSSFGSLASKWRELTQSEIDSWNAATAEYQTVNAFGDDRISSGYELFMRLNGPLVYLGENFKRTPDSPIEMPAINMTGFGTPDNVLFKSDRANTNVLPVASGYEPIPGYSIQYGANVFTSAFALNYPTPYELINDNDPTPSGVSTNPFNLSMNCNIDCLNPKFKLDLVGDEIEFSQDDIPLFILDCGDNKIDVAFTQSSTQGTILLKHYIAGSLDNTYTLTTRNYVNIWNVSMRIDLANDFLDSYIAINSDMYSFNSIDPLSQAEAVRHVYILKDSEDFYAAGLVSCLQMARENPANAQLAYAKYGYIMHEADVLYPMSSAEVNRITNSRDSKTGLYYVENRGILPNKTELTPDQLAILLQSVVKYDTYLAPFIGFEYITDNENENVKMVIEASPYISSGKQGSMNNFKRIAVLPTKSNAYNIGPEILQTFGPVQNSSMIRARYYLINMITGQKTSKKYLPTMGMFPDIISTQYCVVSEGSEPWSQGSCPDDYTCVYNAEYDESDCIHDDYLYELISDTAGNKDKKPKFKAGAELASSVN